MKIFKKIPRDEWPSMCQRPLGDWREVESRVQPILDAVRTEGDAAVRRFNMQFGGSDTLLPVTPDEWRTAEALVPHKVRDALSLAVLNVRKFHEKELLPEQNVETVPGVRCWRRSVPIEKAGLYIPGGTAPLVSTVIMLGIPAALAGCSEVVMTSPPRTDGSLDPALLSAAALVGIKKVFKAGGAQAIAALAYGTESVPKVDKIFGPGNQYVTAAKILVQNNGTAIDMPAGPTELCVLADSTAVPAFVAADLLSQAEHGGDSQAVLITTSEEFATNVLAEVELQRKSLSRSQLIDRSLASGFILLVDSLREGLDFSNRYAPEHLILACKDALKWSEYVTNAGSVFIGNYSPEAAGDYASGTNHTLPTAGAARAYSGVSVASFMKAISFQALTAAGLESLSETIETLAELEGLDAHRNASAIRRGKPHV